MPKSDSMKGTMKGATGADQMKSGSDMGGRGANRGSVEAMQRALKDKGFDPGDIDGRLGPKTQGALKEFQQKEGLSTSGQFDAETRAKLGMQGAGSMSPATSPSAPKTR